MPFPSKNQYCDFLNLTFCVASACAMFLIIFGLDSGIQMVISDYLTGSQKLVFLLLLGIGLFGWEVYSAAKSNEASSWPSTTATITQSEIKKVRKSRRRRGRRRSSWSRELHVQYDYYVQGQSYNNNRVAFGNSVSNALDSIGRPNVVDQYPKGKSVTVYYNPDNPKDSVLETELPFSAYIVMVVALIMCTVSAVPLFATDQLFGSTSSSELEATPAE